MWSLSACASRARTAILRMPRACSSSSSAASAASAMRGVHAASAVSHSAAAAASPSIPATPRRRASVAAAGAPPAPLPTTTVLPAASPTFEQLRVPLNLVHRLAANSIHRPTVIQRAAMPHLMRRPWDAHSYPDVLLQEMTGQGKTLAYLLPMLANIDRTVPRIQAMIVVPTRELAVQVTRVLHELAEPTSSRALPLAVATLLGDAANPSMLSGLVRAAQRASPLLLNDEGVDPAGSLLPQHHPHVIVGQPGAVHDVFVQQALSDVRTVLPLTHLKYLIFDEADALLNAQSSRNLMLPLIGLRHGARALELAHVKAEQAHLDATRTERRDRKKRVEEELEAEAAAEAEQQRRQQQGEGEEAEQEQQEGQEEQEQVEQQEEQQQQPEQQSENAQSATDLSASTTPSSSVDAASSATDASSTSALSVTPSPAAVAPAAAAVPAFPRNQVVFVSATITPAVHQFAARFLSSSRAFITSASVAGEADRLKALKRVLSSPGMEVVQGALAAPEPAQHVDATAAAAPSNTAVATRNAHAVSSHIPNRMPSHLRHYYLLVNRPYDRQNSLQQLLQAIKFQFERWKKSELNIGSDGADAAALAVKPPSAGWIAKQLGPKRAQSAGGVAASNARSPVKHLRGGVPGMGVGARAHFMQTTLVFCAQRTSLAPLVNPLSQQGFNVGVVSEHSSRHERREGLQLHKGVELVLSTDVLARGMDLKALTHVVNWDVPSTATSYLHRAGRVGRLGAVHARLGTVITLVDLQKDPRALEHLSKMCATLSGTDPHTRPMMMRRLYVKKGHMYEDVDETHDITPTQAPSIQTFVVDKTAREQARTEVAQSEQGADTPAAQRRTAAAAVPDAEYDSAPSLTSLDPLESRSAARLLETPMFGPGGLDAGSIAALELAQGGDSTAAKMRRNHAKETQTTSTISKGKKKMRDVRQQAARPRR